VIQALPSLQPFDVPRPPLWGVGECVLAEGVVDTPITHGEIERDAAWMTEVLSGYGIGRGDVVVLAVGPAEAAWAHPMMVAISRHGGTVGMAWSTRFDARRVGVLARNLDAKMIIGLTGAGVEALAEQRAGILNELKAVQHLLVRADAHAGLEAVGGRPLLFDLVGPAVLIEPSERTGAIVNEVEWQIAERDGTLEVTTVGDRGLRLSGAATDRSGSIRGHRIVLDGVIR
jgi:hypothetical protein